MEISHRLHVPKTPSRPRGSSRGTSSWPGRQLVDVGLPLRDKAAAWADLQELRTTYGDELERLIDARRKARGW